MRTTCFLLAITLLLLSERSLYAQSFTQAETRARDYSVEGATFGMTLSDFEKKFSVGRPHAMDPSNHTIKHEIVAGEKTVQFSFYRGRLSTISQVFSFKGDDRVEREMAVEHQMVKMFGKPLHSSDAADRWSFPNVKRNIFCAPSRDNFITTVSDTSMQQ